MGAEGTAPPANPYNTAQAGRRQAGQGVGAGVDGGTARPQVLNFDVK
jgi:hypothetical protein